MTRALVIGGAGFVAVNVASYFLISWTPKVLVGMGFSVAEGAKGSMLLTFGGAAYLGERVHARHWLDWAVGVAVTFALQLAVAFAAGLPPEARRGVLGRWRAMVATTRG